MDLKQAGASLDSLISSFNARIAELQELVIARNMYPANNIPDLSEIDTTVRAMEFQMQSIKNRLREETEAIPKAKKLVEKSLRQQQKLQNMLSHMPSQLCTSNARQSYKGSVHDTCSENLGFGSLRIAENHAPPLGFGSSTIEEDPAPQPKEKKSRSSLPLWYVTAEELDSLSSYMKGRLTLEKVNAAIDDMATYAEANAQLISSSKMKEFKDLALKEALKGKHFFLETDIKGPALKLDNTGKAIITVLRHLGRINESRIGTHRVIILIKPQ
ncbi:hypothetical protein ACHQM5_001360 [Ranunculus cassubicifolius]